MVLRSTLRQSQMLCRYCLCQRAFARSPLVRGRAAYATSTQTQRSTDDKGLAARSFPRPYTLPPQQSPAREANLKDGGATVPGTPSTAINPQQAPQATIIDPGLPKPASTSTGTERKRRPARPRKAVLTLTPDAVSRLKEIQSSDGKFIKVSVVAKGCAGGAYKLEYVTAVGRFDEKVEQDGVTVLVDSKSLMKIIGSEMDYSDDLLASRFTFNNPNVVSTCGCEESFATKEDEERLLGQGRV